MQSLQKNLDSISEAINRQKRAFKNELSDTNSLLRDLKFEFSQIKMMLLDNRAISDNLPHNEVKDYLPFDSDESVVTVLNSSTLSNALYAKVLTSRSI